MAKLKIVVVTIFGGKVAHEWDLSNEGEAAGQALQATSSAIKGELSTLYLHNPTVLYNPSSIAYAKVEVTGEMAEEAEREVRRAGFQTPSQQSS